MEMDDEDETDVAMTKEVEQYLEQHHTAQDTVQAPSQFGFCRFLKSAHFKAWNASHMQHATAFAATAKPWQVVTSKKGAFHPILRFTLRKSIIESHTPLP